MVQANIEFIARGGSGEEKIAGLLITGDNRLDQVIPIRLGPDSEGASFICLHSVLHCFWLSCAC